jgi:hypothetical protein
MKFTTCFYHRFISQRKKKTNHLCFNILDLGLKRWSNKNLCKYSSCSRHPSTLEVCGCIGQHWSPGLALSRDLCVSYTLVRDSAEAWSDDGAQITSRPSNTSQMPLNSTPHQSIIKVQYVVHHHVRPWLGHADWWAHHLISFLLGFPLC